MESLGSRLKALRLNKRLTLEKMADELNAKYPGAINFNKGKLSKWENDIDAPLLSSAKLLANYFDISLDQLIFGISDSSKIIRNLANTYDSLQRKSPTFALESVSITINSYESSPISNGQFYTDEGDLELNFYYHHFVAGTVTANAINYTGDYVKIKQIQFYVEFYLDEPVFEDEYLEWGDSEPVPAFVEHFDVQFEDNELLDEYLIFLDHTKQVYRTADFERLIERAVRKSYYFEDYMIGMDQVHMGTIEYDSQKMTKRSKTPTPRLTEVPVVEKLAAGVGYSYGDNESSLYYTQRDNLKPYDFASLVSGDSMEPVYTDGDVVLIQSGYDNINGAVYAVDYDGKSFLKRVFFEGDRIRLVSFNKKYNDIYIYLPVDNGVYLNIIGKVVDSFTPVEK